MRKRIVGPWQFGVPRDLSANAAATGLAGGQADLTKTLAGAAVGRASAAATLVGAAPSWLAIPSFTVAAGQVTSFQLPVAAGSASVAVSWSNTSNPSIKPDWITFTAGTPPTINFLGGQVEADDILNTMVLSATANSQSSLSQPGSVLVTSADPSWQQALPATIYTSQMPFNLASYVDNWNPSLHLMREATAADVVGYTAKLPGSGISLSSSGILTYQGSGGASQVNVQAVVVNSAEADWLARITDSSVVWYHDFRSDAEVNAFRWTGAYGGGNDPNALGSNGTYCRRITTDGIDAGGGQGCLEIVWPSSGQYGNSYWWRPLSPLTGASNGRGVDDPAANNTITRRTMIATDGGSQTAQFIYGYYGDPNYQSLYPGQFDGNDYYLQVRVKMDPARITAGLNPGGNQFGKIFYLTRTDTSLTSQEINTESYQPGYNTRNYFSMYRSGSPPLESDTPGMGNQPGGTAGVVWFDNRDGSANNAFYWPSPAKWVTLLYYIKPMITESNATVVRVWKAVAGETSYTKIWDQTTIPLPYGAGKPYGHNALIFCSYQNQLVAANGFYHRMAQVIFKKGDGTGSLSSGIACPNDPVQRGEA